MPCGSRGPAGDAARGPVATRPLLSPTEIRRRSSRNLNLFFKEGREGEGGREVSCGLSVCVKEVTQSNLYSSIIIQYNHLQHRPL